LKGNVDTLGSGFRVQGSGFRVQVQGKKRKRYRDTPWDVKDPAELYHERQHPRIPETRRATEGSRR